MSLLNQEEKETVAFWWEHGLSFFLKDFFHAGNLDFKIEIHPHRCETGLWYSATWQDKAGQKKVVGSMRHKLLWDRVMEIHLIQQREEASHGRGSEDV